METDRLSATLKCPLACHRLRGIFAENAGAIREQSSGRGRRDDAIKLLRSGRQSRGLQMHCPHL